MKEIYVKNADGDLERVVVTDEVAELQTLLTSAKKNDSSIYLFLLLVAMTGCRKGEILGLTWDKVDFANQTIAIVQNRTGDTKDLIYSVKRVKTKTSNRIIYVSDELTELLKKDNTEYLYSPKYEYFEEIVQSVLFLVGDIAFSKKATFWATF